MNGVVSILDEEFHSRLIQNLDEIALTANIPVYLIKRSAKEFCTLNELDWLRGIKLHSGEGSAGLCIVGEQALPIDTKMMALGAALLRNYIDARVVPITDLVEAGTDMSSVPSPTVMLVPNFFIPSGGKPLAGWNIQALHSILLSRFAAGKQTVLYVRDMPELLKVYGQGIHDHIQAHYTIL